MKIGLQTWGTDGDFMPFLALAIGLREAGHEVMLAYTSIDGKDYSGRTDTDGIELIRANGDVQFSSRFNPYAIDAKPGSFKEYTTLLENYFEPFTETMYGVSSELCQKCDLVIGHAVCHTLLTASEKFNVPRVSLVLTPLVVRSDHASPIGVPLGTILNSFLWNVGGAVATQQWFKQGKALRKREGLPPIKSLQKELFTSNVLTLVAVSEAIAPRQPDWSDTVKVSGFLNLPSSNTHWKMPEDLRAFLAAGQQPVYMTFGSCTQFDEEGATELMVEAARIYGKRTIIQSDWSRVRKPTDPNIFCVEQVAHVEVFPLCSLIVHHGGAGTTQSALLAGKPSVVVAHGFDQTYWAHRLESLGLGGKALVRSSVTPYKLSEVIISTLSSTKIVSETKNISKKLSTENGLAKAISVIGTIIEKPNQ